MVIRTAAALAAAVFLSTAHAAGFVDVLTSPAKASPLAARTLLQGIARAGKKLVAVGQRGHIVVSEDGGETWTQSRAPVSSDLTAVFLADEGNGWAVGHDGVILATRDGGNSWELQMNGLRAAAAIGISPHPEARRFADQGADKPFLDVWFADARNGYAVGAYNLLFRTTDGGRTWESWFDRADNPKLLNLYAIRPAGGALFIVGEGGLVLKLDAGAGRFRAIATPYAGSFFGLIDTGRGAIAYGLRGNAYLTLDEGASWSPIDTRLGGAVVAATRTAEGEILLADAAGRVVSSADGGRTFLPVIVKPSPPITAIADAGKGFVVLTGPRGATVARVRPH